MVYCFPFSHTFLKFCIRFLLTEMIFNNVCHDVLNIQSGSAYLLWDKAGSCHTWRGVNLEHIDLVAFRNNVIYAYNSFAIQNIIDGRSQLLYPLSQFRLRRAGVISVTSPLYLALKSKNSFLLTTSVIGNTTDLSWVL